MNVANLRVIRAVIGSVAMVPLTSSGFRHKYGIVLVGNSIARLILNCFRGHFQINAFKLIYIKCSGPHANVSSDSQPLEKLEFGQKRLCSAGFVEQLNPHYTIPDLGFEEWREGYIWMAGSGSDPQTPRPSTKAARSFEDLD